MSTFISSIKVCSFSLTDHIHIFGRFVTNFIIALNVILMGWDESCPLATLLDWEAAKRQSTSVNVSVVESISESLCINVAVTFRDTSLSTYLQHTLVSQLQLHDTSRTHSQLVLFTKLTFWICVPWPWSKHAPNFIHHLSFLICLKLSMLTNVLLKWACSGICIPLKLKMHSYMSSFSLLK